MDSSGARVVLQDISVSSGRPIPYLSTAYTQFCKMLMPRAHPRTRWQTVIYAIPLNKNKASQWVCTGPWCAPKKKPCFIFLPKNPLLFFFGKNWGWGVGTNWGRFGQKWGFFLEQNRGGVVQAELHPVCLLTRLSADSIRLSDHTNPSLRFGFGQIAAHLRRLSHVPSTPLHAKHAKLVEFDNLSSLETTCHWFHHIIHYHFRTFVGKLATTFQCFHCIVPSSLKSFTHFFGNCSRKKPSVLPQKKLHAHINFPSVRMHQTCTKIHWQRGPERQPPAPMAFVTDLTPMLASANGPQTLCTKLP